MTTAAGGLWHRYAAVAYAAVFIGMIGHATSAAANTPSPASSSKAVSGCSQ